MTGWVNALGRSPPPCLYRCSLGFSTLLEMKEGRFKKGRMTEGNLVFRGREPLGLLHERTASSNKTDTKDTLYA